VVTSTGCAPARTAQATNSAALVLADQMRAANANRLGDPVGRLDAAETREADRAIKLILGTL